MLGAHDIIGFVATANPPAARRFHEDALGLRLIGETPFAPMFDANGTMPRVTRVSWITPDGGKVARDLDGNLLSLTAFNAAS